MSYAIRAEGLSKSYLLGAHERRHTTLGDALAHAMRHPLKTIRRMSARDRPEVFWALKDLDLEVGRGEVLGVIGRNGAGKSTLLKILSRITEPTAGRAVVNGRLTSLLEVGTGFHPELSGRENIFLNATILGMRRQEIARKLDEIVAFSGVERFLDTPVKHYSSGMYVRLAFAVAAHVDADILLVDEVLAVGDAEFRSLCLAKMGDVAKGGRTVVFVSHNMSAIQTICSSCVLLSGGTLQAAGRTSEIVREYLQDHSARVGIVQRESGIIRLLSSNGSSRLSTSNQSEVRVQMTFESDVSMSDLTIDFGLENEVGVRIVNILPNERGGEKCRVTAGVRFEYLVTFAITALAPGRYFAYVYAYSVTFGHLLHQTNIPVFVVEPSPSAPECASQGFSAILLPEYEAGIAGPGQMFGPSERG